MSIHTKLTSAEIGNLWLSYINNKASICLLLHFLKTVEDQEIKQVIELGLDISQQALKSISKIFKEENYAIPYGFAEEDVNLNAPRLFTDIVYLNILKSMGKAGVATYGIAFSLSSRDDVRTLFHNLVNLTIELDNKSLSTLKTKGLYVRPPYITVPDKVSYVHKESFFSGFFTNQRPLTAPEITHLFSNLDSNTLGRILMIGFSQVAKSKKLREAFWKGHQIAQSHLQSFSSKLEEDDLPAPSPWDSGVTKSQEPPYSDKLMSFFTTFLTATGIGNYGLAIAASPRNDIASMYAKMFSEIGLYANQLAKILVENGWMEEPPQSENRRDLALQ